MNNRLILQKLMNDRENMLVKKYLRKYINGFKSNDIKALEKDCIKEEVSYHLVFEKLADEAYYSY